MTKSIRIVADRYEIGENAVLGRGVSATVYRARDRRSGCWVAIKEINPFLATDPISLERFRREIQVVRHIEHPLIVGTYDLLDDADGVYLVLELVEGITLKQLIYDRGPLPELEALAIVAQVLDVLAACHRRDVVHRDLNPNNVMIEKESHGVRVLDFGLARMTSLVDLTQPGTTLGSPEYMAPELFSGNRYDPRTDLYAVGIIAYELMTGRTPYRADSVEGLCHQHWNSEPPDLRLERAGASAWVADFVLRLTAKHPFERYQSAGEALADLAEQRVSIRLAPKLPTRVCPNCSHETPREPPVCLYCGLDFYKRTGTREVWLADASQSAAAHALLSRTFGDDIRACPRSQGLLLTGAPAHLAELLQAAALRRGFALVSKPERAWWRLRRSGALAALASSIAAILTFGLANLVYPVAQLGAYATAEYLLYRLWRRQPIAPWLEIDAHAAHDGDAEWWRQVAPGFSSGSVNTSDLYRAQLLERFLLLQHVAEIPEELRQKMQQLLASAMAPLQLLSSVEEVLRDPRRVELVDTYRFGADLRLDTSSLNGGTATAQDALRGYQRLDERLASLTNRLIDMHCAFNSLLGKALGTQQVLSAHDGDDLGRAVKHLAEAAEACRRARADLGVPE